MTPQHDAQTEAALKQLLEEHHLTGESLLYRETLPEFLAPTGEPGVFRLTANDDPSEAVIDVYAQGHVGLAQECGPGLAFAEPSENQWRTADRTSVAVRVQDVLDQGGLMYPVESVITERVWYFTLPEGSIQVRKVDEHRSRPPSLSS